MSEKQKEIYDAIIEEQTSPSVNIKAEDLSKAVSFLKLALSNISMPYSAHNDVQKVVSSIFKDS